MLSKLYAAPLAPALLRRLHDRLRQPLPILRYGAVRAVQADSAGAGVPSCEQSLGVSLEDFTWQMRHLAQHCNPVPLSLVARYLGGRLSLPARSVVLTIDDGSGAGLRHALPVLNQTGVPATVFTASDSNLRAIAAAEAAPSAIEIGCLGLPPRGGEVTQRSRELAQSKAAKERRLGEPSIFYAYGSPLQPGDDEAIFVAALAGYRLAVTLEPGVNWLRGLSPMTLRRITIPAGLSRASFAALVDLPAWFRTAASGR